MSDKPMKLRKILTANGRWSVAELVASVVFIAMWFAMMILIAVQ